MRPPSHRRARCTSAFAGLLLLGIAAGLPAGAANAAAADLPPAASTVVAVGRTARTAVVATRYGRPLEVRVLDASGSPVPGVSVTFSLGAGAGAATAAPGAGAAFGDGSTQATAVTDAAGHALSPRFTAGTVAGSFAGVAMVTGSPGFVRFALRNLPGRAAGLTPGAGASQAAALGERFAVRLAVTVSDVHGNVVPGAVVTFSAPVEGPRGSFVRGVRGLRARTVRVTTGATGVAIAPPFAATSAQGGYIVRATIVHVAPAAFALVNEQPGMQL